MPAAIENGRGRNPFSRAFDRRGQLHRVPADVADARPQSWSAGRKQLSDANSGRWNSYPPQLTEIRSSISVNWNRRPSPEFDQSSRSQARVSWAKPIVFPASSPTARDLSSKVAPGVFFRATSSFPMVGMSTCRPIPRSRALRCAGDCARSRRAMVVNKSAEAAHRGVTAATSSPHRPRG